MTQPPLPGTEHLANPEETIEAEMLLHLRSALANRRQYNKGLIAQLAQTGVGPSKETIIMAHFDALVDLVIGSDDDSAVRRLELENMVEAKFSEALRAMLVREQRPGGLILP